MMKKISEDALASMECSVSYQHNGIELEYLTYANTVTLSKAHGNLGCDIVQLGSGNTFIDNEAGCTQGF